MLWQYIFLELGCMLGYLGCSNKQYTNLNTCLCVLLSTFLFQCRSCVYFTDKCNTATKTTLSKYLNLESSDKFEYNIMFLLQSFIQS